MINHEALRAKYNPEGSELRNMQYEMLKALLFLDKICKENNIPYFLTGGTLLGAIRHQGFIPWDDDLDIALLKKDYKKLYKILLQLSSDEYVFQSQETDFNYINVFPKFRAKKGNYLGSIPARGELYKYRGVAIDIFCTEKISYLTALLSHIYHYALLHYTYKIKNHKLRFIITKTAYNMYSLTVPFFYIFNIFRRKRECHNGLGQGFARQYQDEQTIMPLKETLFEDHFFPIPGDPYKFLTNLYGPSWKNLPDESVIKRTIHNKALIKKDE